MNITELVKKAHDNAVKKGFYGGIPFQYCPECKSFLNCKKEYREPSGYCDLFVTKEKNIGELLMLVVSELGEALEAHRKDIFTDFSDYSISELTLDGFKEFTTDGEIKAFENCIKDSFEDELADAVIRIADMCGYLGIDLEKHIELKMKYNETREYKHGKKY